MIGDDYSRAYIDYSNIRSFLHAASKEYRVTFTEGDGSFYLSYGVNRYTYWPKSNKWRVKGSKKIYRSGNIRSFIEKFVIKAKMTDKYNCMDVSLIYNAS